jgi:hypothetical protein
LKPTLLVMAAGLGSRFGGEKQLEPVGPSGEALLDYSVFDAQRAGFRRVVFVVRKEMAGRFHETVGRRYEDRLDVAYVHQESSDLPTGFTVPRGRTKPWGTGQAVLAAAGAIDGPFAVANADDFYGQDAFARLGAFLAAPERAAADSPYALVLYRLRDTVSEHGTVARGICTTTPDGRLTRVTEVTTIEAAADGAFRSSGPEGEQRYTGDEPVSLNLWGFTPSLFALLREGFSTFLRRCAQDATAEFYLPVAIDSFVKSGAASVQTLPTTSRWFGLTYREDKKHVAERLREMTDRGDYPTRLWD